MATRDIIKLIGGVLKAVSTQAAATPKLEVPYRSIDFDGGCPYDDLFPEARHLPPPGAHTLGVAISGGGTRSAAAALGQLRGLHANGWLGRVRYLSAVSGGAWAATPFTFTGTDLAIFLGQPRPPGEIRDDATLQATGGEACLGHSIADSGLTGPGLRAALPQIVNKVVDRIGEENEALGAALKTALEALGPDDDQSEIYSSIIGRLFIDPHVADGGRRLFTWTDATRAEARRLNPQLADADFVVVPAGRPFLILGGTIIEHRPLLTYPNLIPVEYTPYYVTVRQRFGRNLGGILVSSYGYDTSEVTPRNESTAAVQTRSAKKRFTLHDVVGSTGAAPQLFFYVSDKIPDKIRGIPAGVFPEFDHWTVRDGEAHGLPTPVPHGDGGFLDNLGMMPLLARGVTRIIAFINSKGPYKENHDLMALFGLSDRHDTNGDKRHNLVFADGRRRYDELIADFDARVGRGTTVMHCGKSYQVVGNDRYGIRPYGDVTVCWIYNHPVEGWIGDLADTELARRLPVTRDGELVKQRDAAGQEIDFDPRFERFPWYNTFGEAKPRVMDLKPEQVNLLAHLSCWTVTNDASRTELLAQIGDAL